eukprot:gene11346-14429_t
MSLSGRSAGMRGGGTPPTVRQERGSGGDEAFADGEADEVGLGLEAEFAEEIGAVRLRGARADKKFFGDTGIIFSLGGELEDHALAGGERLQEVGGIGGFSSEGVDGPFGKRGAEETAAGEDFADGGGDFGGGGAFQDVGGGAGAEGLDDVGFVVVHREDEDARGWRGLADLAEDFQA